MDKASVLSSQWLLHCTLSPSQDAKVTVRCSHAVALLCEYKRRVLLFGDAGHSSASGFSSVILGKKVIFIPRCDSLAEISISFK